MTKVKVTQTGSPIRRQKDQRAALIGLGLNRIRRSRIVDDTPELRGQVRKVQHMVMVEAVHGDADDRKQDQ